MPPGSGRKPFPEWAEVEETGTKVKCKHCNQEVSARIERIRAHLSGCKMRISQRNKNTARSQPSYMEGNLALEDTLPFEDDTVEDCAPGPSKRKQSQPAISAYGVTTSKKQKGGLDAKVATFFYACNVPFNVAQRKEFKDMVASLRPGYGPPDRKQLGGKLLDDAFQAVEDSLKKELTSVKSVTLLIDGWSSCQNDPVTAVSVHTGQKSYLLDMYDSGSQKKTAEYCAARAEDAMKKIQDNFGCDVFAVCTDNENKMLKMRKLLEESHSGLVTYGCSAHYLNLLVKQVLPSKLLNKIVRVQKYFKNHHQPHGWLQEKNGLLPQLPCDTRWSSNFECVRTFLENFHKYNEIRLEHPSDFCSDVAAVLESPAIFTDTRLMKDMLGILNSALSQLQSEKATLSTAAQTWISLEVAPELHHVNAEIKYRASQALAPAHFLAYLMDPSAAPDILSQGREEIALNWLAARHPEFVPFVLKFKVKDPETFPQYVMLPQVLEEFVPGQWWHVLGIQLRDSQKLPATFCDYFAKLLSCTASAASIERIFSSCGMVWSAVRNRLGLEKAAKLVEIHRHFRSD
ncbi:uncharacterized protein LOC135384411 [Ornithodoros turicata]|uniref:uncharacterized protein LOC135384411 n=1 Tax=Ornithodoros turicata TaxID=34597 RepID=UPI003139691C